MPWPKCMSAFSTVLPATRCSLLMSGSLYTFTASISESPFQLHCLPLASENTIKIFFRNVSISLTHGFFKALGGAHLLYLPKDERERRWVVKRLHTINLPQHVIRRNLWSSQITAKTISTALAYWIQNFLCLPDFKMN